MRLDDVRRFDIAEVFVADTDGALREAGAEGYERFVLWSGTITGEIARIQAIHVPEQTAFKTDTGLLVRVDGDALHKLNSWLYENGETLLAQVHAHPTEAYHSETDDAYPIVTALGSLSVVAAHFGRYGSLGTGSALYRLTPDGWCLLRGRHRRKLLRVT